MKAPRDKFTEGLMGASALGLMPRSIVAAVTEAFTPDRLTLDERRFLAGPLIVHNPQGWPLPDWLADAAGAERIGIVFGVTPHYIVGPAEISAVMFGASMDAPMDRDHVDLYLWATINAHAKRKGFDPVTLFGELLNMRPITDDEVLERGGRLHETYRRLAEDIRRKVVAHQAGRDREAKRGEQQEQKGKVMRPEQPRNNVGPDTRPPVIAEQMFLFGGPE
jgi:hypothetical protein